MKQKIDLRIVKTKKILFSSLLNLMKSNAFENIKVSDICSEALINRSTFYAHYNDKYELLIDFINDLKDNLESTLEKNKHIINTKEYYMEMIKLLLNHIDEKRDIYYPILINNRNSIVMDILLDVVEKDIKKKFKNNSNTSEKIPSEFIAKFYLGAVVSVGIEWLKNDTKYKEEDILNYLNALIPDTIVEI